MGSLVERGAVERLLEAVRELPQYQPETRHFFHGGMYCRAVWRKAGALVVGAAHKKEHFYLIVFGTVVINPGDGAEEITGPRLMLSEPGTQRAVYSLTPALCLTFHRTDATTVEAAEAELVEPDERSSYGPGNVVKAGVVSHDGKEKLQ